MACTLRHKWGRWAPPRRGTTQGRRVWLQERECITRGRVEARVCTITDTTTCP